MPNMFSWCTFFWNFYHCLSYGIMSNCWHWGWWINCPFTVWRIDNRGSVSIACCRRYIIVSKGTFQRKINIFHGKIYVKFRFLTFVIIWGLILKVCTWVASSKLKSEVKLKWSVGIKCENKKMYRRGYWEPIKNIVNVVQIVLDVYVGHPKKANN